MKIKILFSVLLLTLIIISCNKSENNDDNFDHEAQALVDDVFVKEYLESHYYIPATTDQTFGTIDSLDVNAINAGETPLMDQVTTQVVNFNDIDYNLYYLKNLPGGIGTSPTKVDSVLVKYQGLTIDYFDDEPQFDQRTSFTWLLLTSVIPGWSYGFPNFKSGTNLMLPDEPLTYEDTGTGVLFIPSGLAYRNIGSTGVSINTPIMFHIELAQVEEADHDFDFVSSNYENLDGDDDYTNDDTDGDNSPNYIDIDDDGDRLLTRYENPDPNEDGNPNDAIDTDGDNIPNYLDDDDDGDGVLTINENADDDANGNPDDAQDLDGDNIPDYLDPDTN